MVARVTLKLPNRLWVLADSWRQLDNWLYSRPKRKDMMKDDEREYRYEERGGDFLLKCWHDGRETTTRGHYHERPAWLDPILAVAKINGSAKRVKEPPPDFICWFRTTASGALTEFIELE
jgi:hypothetical protein